MELTPVRKVNVYVLPSALTVGSDAASTGITWLIVPGCEADEALDDLGRDVQRVAVTDERWIRVDHVALEGDDEIAAVRRACRPRTRPVMPGRTTLPAALMPWAPRRPVLSARPSLRRCTLASSDCRHCDQGADT